MEGDGRAMSWRADLLRDVARRIPVGGPGCVLVGVDGVDGSGKSTFANELADVVLLSRAVIRISVDDFHHGRAVRYRRGRDSPEGYWQDAFDYQRLRRFVLDPLGPGGSSLYRLVGHDLATDQALDPEPEAAPPGCVVIVDGVFLHRDELADVWQFSVFLRVPFEETVMRMARRDGTPADPSHPILHRYVQGQRLYFARCSPEQRASIVIDNCDLDRPILVSAVAGTEAVNPS